MNIIHCGGCGTPIQVPPGSEGQPLRCPRCGSANLVAAAGAVPAGSAAPVHPGQSPIAWTAQATVPQGWPAYPPANPTGKATASLVLGAVGLVAWFCPVIGLPISITGLVLGVMGRKSSSGGMATAGIILSTVSLGLTIGNIALGAYLGATGKLFGR